MNNNNESKTRKRNTNTNIPSSQRRKTIKKIPDVVEKLNKSSRYCITGMESYKINCGKNLLIGYQSIKGSEETSIHKDEFVHVALAELKDYYNKPVIVKVYDENNVYLRREQRILQTIHKYRNTARVICEFSCNDDKNRYITKIKKQIQFCSRIGTDTLHFIVYEYIAHGDISQYLKKNTDNIPAIISLMLQCTCVIIELVSIYRIYQGDLNSGNMLIDITHEKTIDYLIDGEIVTIESHGIIPKLIDYGKGGFYKEVTILKSYVWEDIMTLFGIISNYIQNKELKQKVLNISMMELELPTFKDYYIYVQNQLQLQL